MKKLIFLAVAIISGCASTTVIKSAPDGATLFLNGEKVGVTPYRYTDKKIVGSDTNVWLKKECYQDFTTVLMRNEDLNIKTAVAGVFALFPFFWVMDYKPVHFYEMEPLTGCTASATNP